MGRQHYANGARHGISIIECRHITLNRTELNRYSKPGRQRVSLRITNSTFCSAIPPQLADLDATSGSFINPCPLSHLAASPASYPNRICWLGCRVNKRRVFGEALDWWKVRVCGPWIYEQEKFLVNIQGESQTGACIVSRGLESTKCLPRNCYDT